MKIKTKQNKKHRKQRTIGLLLFPEIELLSHKNADTLTNSEVIQQTKKVSIDRQIDSQIDR